MKQDATPGAGPQEDHAAQADEGLGDQVEEIVNALLKAVRARQTYVPGNPLVDRFHGELCDRLRFLWEDMPHLSLTVDEGRLLWREREVYAKAVGPDNFAFRFFKDGIRTLALLPGVEESELAEFMDVLSSSRSAQDEDLLATLWHRDFKAIKLDYVDVSEDDALKVPASDRGRGAGESLADMSEIEEVLQSSPVSEEEAAGFSDVSLGEPDLLYLKREIEGEWKRPLVHDVTLALLDQFEMRDQERRRQVVDILRELLPRLLTERDFGNVAIIVNELQLLANKTGEIETQDLVTSLLRDMSEAMAELVSETAGAEDSPAAEELAALVGALQAEAIPTLVRAIPSVPDRRTRDQLSQALDRLVGGNRGYVVDLLSAEDPMLAAEAARIVGRLGMHEAEANLAELARRPEEVTRQAAIEALAMLGSESGAGALVAALADPARDIRLAALNAISTVKPEGANSMMLSWVSRKDMARRDQTEQMAFLRTLAAVAGESAVPTLARLLNGRRWWGGRRPPTLRAAAARVLGTIDSEEARAALEKASADRAAPVKSAVRVALRSLGEGLEDIEGALHPEFDPDDATAEDLR